MVDRDDGPGPATCRYCPATFETERGYLRHLARDHESWELGRIDRRRVAEAFPGRGTWWTDRLEERLAATPPAGAVGYLRSLDSPVPPRTLRTLAVLGAGLTVAVAALLAASGP